MRVSSKCDSRVRLVIVVYRENGKSGASSIEHIRTILPCRKNAISVTFTSACILPIILRPS